MAQTETATLGGGCFWCVEAAFLELRGVHTVTSGYAGGTVPEPTYKQVCTGRTGHAEVIQVTFDPDEISYRDLLRVFFTVHDPTTLNRQGADVGTQYRSVILAENEEQEQIARAVIAEVDEAGNWPAKVVTGVQRLETFWPAEPEHHNFFARNPANAYCQAVAVPKINKLRKSFRERLRAAPVNHA